MGLAFALAALWQAAPAGAVGEPAFGCGHEHTGSGPAKPLANAKGPAELRLPAAAIGDSTMLLPIPDLTKVGFNVNAKGCRGFKQSVWVARDLRNEGKLPAAGPDQRLRQRRGQPRPDQVRPQGHRAATASSVLVTAYDADTGEPPAPDTDVIVQAAQDHPDQIKLLDWVKYSLPHHKVEPEPGAWFLPDLFHPNFDGAHDLRQLPRAGAARRPTHGDLASPQAAAAPRGGRSPSAARVLLAALAFFFVRRRRA